MLRCCSFICHCLPLKHCSPNTPETKYSELLYTQFNNLKFSIALKMEMKADSNEIA